MRNRLSRAAVFTSGVLALSLLATGAVAQDAAPAEKTPAAPSPENVTKRNTSEVNYLVKMHKVSNEEAERRLGLQKEVSALAYKLAQENPDQFGGAFVDQEPVFKVVILFKDAESRNAVRDSVSPQLRSYLQLQRAKRSEKETRAAIDKLSGTLKTAGVPAIVGFDSRNQKIVVTVTDDTKQKALSALIPADLAPDVLTKIGRLPQNVQAGYVSGDYTYGGWATYDTAGNPYCTTGYVVRMSDARYGVTTAAHCTAVPNPRIWTNGHYVTLAAAAVINNSDYYDFKVHPTGSLDVSGYVAYTNNQPIRGYTSIVNSEYGFPNSGYFGVEDGLYHVYDYVGDVRCKSGQRTGLTCGEITDTYATYSVSSTETRYGMVAVGNPDTRVIAYQGDSGGPMFTYPASDGTIRPAGLVTSANGPGTSPCDTAQYSDCTVYYMPIDRINDSQPMQVKTMTGTLNP